MVPPAPALDHLGSVLARLRARPGDGMPVWTDRAGLHVTVAFFGEVPDGRVPALVAALAAAPTPPPVRLRLDGAGTFPERGAPRVLWVGVDGDVDQLAELARSAAAAGAGAGAPARNAGRAYRPHLTVGRWPAAAPAGRGPARALAGYAGPHFAVPDWRLVRSVPGAAGGSRYEPVADWPLTG